MIAADMSGPTRDGVNAEGKRRLAHSRLLATTRKTHTHGVFSSNAVPARATRHRRFGASFSFLSVGIPLHVCRQTLEESRRIR